MTTGFFSIVGHPIPREMQQNMLASAAKLFALPLEQKRTLRPMGTLINRGYELIGSQVLQEGALPDMKEGFFVGQDIPVSDGRVTKHPLLMGENVFPSTDTIPSAELRKSADAYYEAILSLACTVLEILAKGSPYGDVFDAFVSNDPMCNLRLLYYPPKTSQDARQLGAGAKTDFGAITMLFQDGAGGLEVSDESTGTWVAVAPNADAYVVNIGNMLSTWTKNAYKSNVHRVINWSATDRYSVSFFVDGNLDTKLTSLDGSEPLSGEVITTEEHMLRRLGKTYSKQVAVYAV